MSLSLRSFHLFFIAASVLLAAWVGVWGIQSWQANRSGRDLAVGLLFFALGVVLLVYGLRVRKKLRSLAPDDED
jgi:steroid 5-alpha reductase family enzyme